MSARLQEILARKELLRGRCTLERLEIRTAVADLRTVQPWKAAGRAMAGPRVRSRLLEIAVIAIGSTRLKRASRWLARGVLAWRVLTFARSVAASRAANRNAPHGGGPQAHGAEPPAS